VGSRGGSSRTKAAVGRYQEMFKATRLPAFREETAAVLMETAFGAGRNPKGENG
jgi:hypothetical protein